jgi:hypothetical protein
MTVAGSVCGLMTALWSESRRWLPGSNEMAARAGLHVGLVCGTDYFDIWETERGATDRAELSDKGPVGQFLRVLRRYGGFSVADDPTAHAEAIQHVKRENNTAIVEVNQRILRLAPPESWQSSVVETVRRGQQWIDQDIAPRIEHRGIPVGAPVFIPARTSDLPTAKPTREPRKVFDPVKPYGYGWGKIAPARRVEGPTSRKKKPIS